METQATPGPRPQAVKGPNPADRLEQVMQTLQKTRELQGVKDRMSLVEIVAKQIDRTQYCLLEKLKLDKTFGEPEEKHLAVLREGFKEIIGSCVEELEKK